MTPQYEKFASNLKELRLRRHVLQSQLAKIIGVAQPTISLYEKGERFPDIETLEAIADYFNVSLSTLTGNAEYTTEESEALEVADMLLQFEEGRKLCLYLKDCTPEDIKKTLGIIEILKNGNSSDN